MQGERGLQKLSECKGAFEVCKRFKIKVENKITRRPMTNKEIDDTAFWLMKALGLQKALDRDDEV